MAIKSFLSEGGFSVGSVGSAPIEVIDSSGNITAVGLTVSGNLVVNGSTTTINSTTTTLDDPIFTLGGDTVPTSDDNKDRGIEFRWHDGSVNLAKVGFFGFDDSTGKFVFIPNATNTSEVFSGTIGAIDLSGSLSGGTGINFNGSTGAITNTGVTSITGTSNQVTASASTGAITLSLPQSIATTSSPTFAGLTVSGTISGSITGNAGGNSATTTLLNVSDSRNTVDTPQTINMGVVADFKANATNSLSDGGTYNGVLTFRQYGAGTDWSGGASHQLGFTDNGNVWQRSGQSTSWSSWKKMLDSSNYNSYAPTLTGTGASGTWSITAANITSQANSATITAASTNTANTIVLRDGSGNFSAGGITGTNILSYKTSNDAIVKAQTTTAGAYIHADSGTDGYYGLALLNSGTEKWFIGGYGSTDLTFKTGVGSGSQYLTILRGNGNIGIGTSSPAAKVDIYNPLLASSSITNANSHLILSTQNNGTLQQAVIYFNPFNTSGNTSPAAISTIASGNTASALAFFTNPNNSYVVTPTERVRITSDGSVGVGVSSPSAKLHVSEASGVGNFAALKLTNTVTSVNANVDIIMEAGGQVGARIRAIAPGASHNDLAMYVTNSGTLQATPAIFIQGSTNRVGINRSDPSNTLDVNGSVRTTDWYYVENSGNGMYNNANAMWWASHGSGSYSLSSNTTFSGIKLFSGGSQNTFRGHFYGDADGQGFLNSAGNWSLRLDSSSRLIAYSGIANMNAGIRISMPGGAAYSTQLSTVTGAFKIKLPTGRYKSDSMLRMTIKIYQYSTGQSLTFNVGGYNYNHATNTWLNIFAEQESDSNATVYTVRFGDDGTSNCIWIGETNSTWSYPQVFVSEFEAGYSGTTIDWASGWTISAVTAFDTVYASRTSAVKVTSNNIGTYGVSSITGTANQVTASASTGAVTLSLPQNIHTAATPTFSSLTLSGDVLTLSGSGVTAYATNAARIYNQSGVGVTVNANTFEVRTGTSSASLALSVSNTQNTTLAGNLTVSGTGTSSFAGSVNVDGGINFLRGSGEYSTYIKASDYIDAGYNSSTLRYWIELGAKGGTHIVLNTDGSATAAENSYDHFTIWQAVNGTGAIAAGARKFWITNTGRVNFIDSVWHKSSDGIERIHFGSSGSTFYKGGGSGSIHVFRNSSDVDILTLSNAKDAILSGNLAVNGGTGTIDATSGTASATLNLVGRSSGTAKTASIASNSAGSLLLSAEGAGSALGIAANTGNTTVAYNLTVNGTGKQTLGQSVNATVYAGNSATTDQAIILSNTRRANYGDVMIAKNLEGVASADSYATPGTSAATGYAAVEMRYGGVVRVYGNSGATTAAAVVAPNVLAEFTPTGIGLNLNTSVTGNLTVSGTGTINGTSIPASKTLVVTTDKLSVHAATTSAELAGVISDETGTGALVFANTPTLVTPNIGAATGTSVNLTGSGTFGTVAVSGLTRINSSPNAVLSFYNAGVSEWTIGQKTSAFVINNGGNFAGTDVVTISGSATSLSGNLTVGGNLIINGTTTTVNSTTTTLDDPIITLGGDTAPTVDDNKDRGVEFRWHNGTAAKTGFFGYDDSTGYFTFIPDATNTSEVFSGTKGTIDANLVGNVTGNVSGSAGSVATLTAGTYLTGGSFNGSTNVTFAVDATSANTASKVVARDASGNFSAGTITATLTGNATNVSGVVAIANGGTGVASATSANNAVANWGQLEGHGTYTDLNTVPSSWGFSFVQGNANAPHTGSGQWYRGRFSLGSQYGIGTASGTYWLEMAMPRSAGNTVGNLYFRTNESGSVGNWYPVSGIITNSLTAGTYLTGGSYNGSAAVTITVDATSANTASKVVARDGSGNFSAGTITAALSGNATTATTWQTARNFTIGSTARSVNGSADVTWTLADIGAAAASHNHTSLTGVTSIGFAAEASDSASISTTISSTQTFFDFNLTDDNNNDLWRWRFTPSGSTVYNAMTLSPSANGVSDLVVAGTITGTRLISNVATGTAPLTVASTTLVTNLNADLLDGLNSATGNTASTIVARDSSGNFSAGTITATLAGLATSETLSTVTGRGASTGSQISVATGSGGSMFTGTKVGSGYSDGVSGATFKSITDNPNGGSTAFAAYYGGSAGTNSFYVTAVGSAYFKDVVGIGTTSPVANLHVYRATNSTVANLAEVATYSAVKIGKFRADQDHSLYIGNAGSYASFLQGANDAGSNSMNILINPFGSNVGIGTTSPGYKLEVNGSFAATTKSFVIKHPTKEGKKLRYGSLEGPENGVYVRGKLKGSNVIELPDYWTKLVDPESITVQLTPIGSHQKLYVEKIEDNKVYIVNENLLAKAINCFFYVLAERCDVEKLEVEIDA